MPPAKARPRAQAPRLENGEGDDAEAEQDRGQHPPAVGLQGVATS